MNENEENELNNQVVFLQKENNELKLKLEEITTHLKKYTTPLRNKVYYENHKEEILNKNKKYFISNEKKKNMQK